MNTDSINDTNDSLNITEGLNKEYLAIEQLKYRICQKDICLLDVYVRLLSEVTSTTWHQDMARFMDHRYYMDDDEELEPETYLFTGTVRTLGDKLYATFRRRREEVHVYRDRLKVFNDAINKVVTIEEKVDHIHACVGRLRSNGQTMRGWVNDLGLSDNIQGTSTPHWNTMSNEIQKKYGEKVVPPSARDIVTFVANFPYAFWESIQYRSIIIDYLDDQLIQNVSDDGYKPILQQIKDDVREIHKVCTEDGDHQMIRGSAKYLKIIGECARCVASLDTTSYMVGERNSGRFRYTMYEDQCLNIMGTTYKAEMFKVNGLIVRFLVETDTAEKRVYYLDPDIPILLNNVAFLIQHAPDYGDSYIPDIEHTGLTYMDRRIRYMAMYSIDRETIKLYMKYNVEFIAVYNIFHKLCEHLNNDGNIYMLFPRAISRNPTPDDITVVRSTITYIECLLDETKIPKSVVTTIHGDQGSKPFYGTDLEDELVGSTLPMYLHMVRRFGVLDALDNRRRFVGADSWKSTYWNAKKHTGWGIEGGVGIDILALLTDKQETNSVIEALPVDTKLIIAEAVLRDQTVAMRYRFNPIHVTETQPLA